MANQYAELAQDIWPDATPDQIAVLSNALRKGFNRLASPIDPAQLPKKQAEKVLVNQWVRT